MRTTGMGSMNVFEARANARKMMRTRSPLASAAFFTPLLAFVVAQPVVAVASGLNAGICAALAATAVIVTALAYRYCFSALYVVDDGLYVFNPLGSRLIGWHEIEAFETCRPDAFSLRNMIFAPSRSLGAGIRLTDGSYTSVHGLVSDAGSSRAATNATIACLGELTEMTRAARLSNGERRGVIGISGGFATAAA